MKKMHLYFTREELRLLSKLLDFCESDYVRGLARCALNDLPVLQSDYDRLKMIKALNNRFFTAYLKSCVRDLTHA